MTIHASGSAISMSQINAEFALGNAMGGYRGVRWYKDNGSSGLFPSTSLSFSAFYSTRKTSPVTAGSQNITSSQAFTVPTYSVLTITLRGGAGGGGGGGTGGLTTGNTGNPGAVSSFGSYGSADFGRGGGGGGGGAVGTHHVGAAGVAGAGSDGAPAGGTGGASTSGLDGGGVGGAGGKTILTLNNPLSPSGTGPALGSSVTVTVGAGGTGGAAGGGGTAGGTGGNGSVLVAWS